MQYCRAFCLFKHPFVSSESSLCPGAALLKPSALVMPPVSLERILVGRCSGEGALGMSLELISGTKHQSVLVQGNNLLGCRAGLRHHWVLEKKMHWKILMNSLARGNVNKRNSCLCFHISISALHHTAEPVLPLFRGVRISYWPSSVLYSFQERSFLSQFGRQWISLCGQELGITLVVSMWHSSFSGQEQLSPWLLLTPVPLLG